MAIFAQIGFFVVVVVKGYDDIDDETDKIWLEIRARKIDTMGTINFDILQLDDFIAEMCVIFSDLLEWLFY